MSVLSYLSLFSFFPASWLRPAHTRTHHYCYNLFLYRLLILLFKKNELWANVPKHNEKIWMKSVFISNFRIIIITTTKSTDLSRLDQNHIICLTGGVNEKKTNWKIKLENEYELKIWKIPSNLTNTHALAHNSKKCLKFDLTTFQIWWIRIFDIFCVCSMIEKPTRFFTLDLYGIRTYCKHVRERSLTINYSRAKEYHMY